jgi:hypothetical protein
MKRLMLVSALLGAMGFYACKKEDKTVTVTETIHDTISNHIWLNGQVDPNTITAGITVRYGVAVKDSALPAVSTAADAPVLDTMYKRLYKVVEGQYLFIYPKALSGTVAGYYIKVKGATSQFKITYPAVQLPPPRKAATVNNILARGADGFVDSAIVITLPLDIKGDTFQIQYAAYDNSNRVSAPVTASVNVFPQGTKAFNDSLTGTWKYYGSRSYMPGNDGGWIVDTLKPDDTQYYTCIDNKLSASSSETDIELVPSYARQKVTFTFGNYRATLAGTIDSKVLDLDNSSCTNPVYTYTTISEINETGSYFYDAGVRTLAYVVDGQYSNTALQYIPMQIIELTANRLVLGMYANPNNSSTGIVMMQFYK